MYFQYSDGYFCEKDLNVQIKEPAFIIDCTSWSLIKFGEAKILQEKLKTLMPQNYLVMLEIDLENFSANTCAEIINDFLLNRNFLKFQIYKWFINLENPAAKSKLTQHIKKEERK